MSIIELLSSSQNQKGNVANIALAEQIALNNDAQAVKELVDNLNNRNKNIQSDCIKTLYELGYRNPSMIAPYCRNFINLLGSKNNRLIWGGMIALASIAEIKHIELFKSIDLIMQTINKGSVITIDNGVEILAKLNTYDAYFDVCDPLLAEQLWQCPIKQLPMYIEKTLASINIKNKSIYQSIVEKRKSETENASQLKRLEKALKQICNIG